MSTVTENSYSNIKYKEDFSFLIQQYQTLSDRRINHNTLLWDVPSLLFVAQTFLWTIAFSSETNPVIRCAISLISVIIAITSFQSFERNRLMEVVDAEQMYNIEKYFEESIHKDAVFPAIIVHHQLSKRNFILGEVENVDKFLNTHSYYKKHKRKWSLCRQSSVFLWKAVFISSLMFSVSLLVYNILMLFKECLL